MGLVQDVGRDCIGTGCSCGDGSSGGAISMVLFFVVGRGGARCSSGWIYGCVGIAVVVNGGFDAWIKRLVCAVFLEIRMTKQSSRCGRWCRGSRNRCGGSFVISFAVPSTFSVASVSPAAFPIVGGLSMRAATFSVLFFSVADGAALVVLLFRIHLFCWC